MQKINFELKKEVPDQYNVYDLTNENHHLSLVTVEHALVSVFQNQYPSQYDYLTATISVTLTSENMPTFKKFKHALEQLFQQIEKHYGTDKKMASLFKDSQRKETMKEFKKKVFLDDHQIRLYLQPNKAFPIFENGEKQYDGMDKPALLQQLLQKRNVPAKIQFYFKTVCYTQKGKVFFPFFLHSLDFQPEEKLVVPMRKDGNEREEKAQAVPFDTLQF